MKKYAVVGILVMGVIGLAGCSSTPTASGTYKDGNYDVVGNYNAPSGPEQIKVKVTLQNNVVTDATVIGSASRSQSARYQSIFIDGFKPLVVGKNIDQLNLSRVSGASLTTNGFNDAIAKIKAQAKV